MVPPVRSPADLVDGNGRRYAGGQQGDEEAVQRNRYRQDRGKSTYALSIK
jgi:hypothetical protein